MKSYQQFFAEMKRRHVFKVAGVYGIVSFGLLQVADLALPRLGLPDWTVTFMLALLLLFFPVALILAWAFEVTPDGVARTAPGPAATRVDEALAQLRGGLENVSGTWIPDTWMPAFDSLRARPEFQELLDSAGLAGATVQRTPVDERTRPLILREDGE